MRIKWLMRGRQELARWIQKALCGYRLTEERRETGALNVLKEKQLPAGLAPATIARAAAVASVALGGVVLAGWWLNVLLLRSVWPGGPPMTANAAVILV